MPAHLHRNHCRVCRHDRRTEIDDTLAGGGVLRAVAQQYGVHYASLHRHRVHGRLQTTRQETAARQRQGTHQMLEQAQALHLEANRASSLPQLALALRKVTALLIQVCEAQTREVARG